MTVAPAPPPRAPTFADLRRLAESARIDREMWAHGNRADAAAKAAMAATDAALAEEADWHRRRAAKQQREADLFQAIATLLARCAQSAVIGAELKRLAALDAAPAATAPGEDGDAG